MERNQKIEKATRWRNIFRGGLNGSRPSHFERESVGVLGEPGKKGSNRTWGGRSNSRTDIGCTVQTGRRTMSEEEDWKEHY